MLEKIKLALRISHDYLDSEINDTIDTARAELLRSGVSSEVSNSDLDLVQMAIKTYCLYIFSSDSKLAEGYFKSWQYQVENIRKSTIAVPDPDETTSDTTEEG